MPATRPLSDAPQRPRPTPAARKRTVGGIPRPDDRFFRHLVGSMRNGVIAIHRNGALALMNDEAYRIFALARGLDDVGRPITDVFRQRPDLVRVLSGAFEMTTLPNRAELRLKDIDRVIGYTLSQVKDEGGTALGAVMFFKDLTQVEQMEERERLRDRLASLGEMAAGIAHELKNPLAGIEVMAGLLRRQVPDSPDAQSLLADILSEAKLANAIVVEMLEFVRPIRLQVEPIDIAQVLQQAVMNAESKVPRRNVEISVDVLERLPLIDGDASQLCQVFSNLLTNAFEAVNGAGRVAMRATLDSVDQDPAFGDASQTTQAVVVDVTDDGPGVPAELSDRIFNPFFTTKTTGTGLGLPIVRKIVDAHDGRIDLSSEPGRGTRFRVTLPVSSKSSWFK
ncbi:MAG TPA: ATP-binding protein [Vicinamibacterales bacterium]|nr:ATP-binding protein [Vicinamibacterales bacterium]